MNECCFVDDKEAVVELVGGLGTESREFSEFINSGSAADAKGLSAVVGEAAKAGGAR